MCFAKSFKNRQEFVEYYSAMSDAVVTTRTYADGVTLTEVLDREDNGAILITNDSGNSVTGWLYDEGYEDYINGFAKQHGGVVETRAPISADAIPAHPVQTA